VKLEQFHYLLEINRLHSISAAARSLHIGQTTLSAIVKVAEENVGFPIFQRTPNGVIPTPMGARFMALAWEINVKYEELLAVKRRVTGSAPAITLLISPSIAASLALPLLDRFSTYDVPCNLIFEETASEQISEQLLDNAGSMGLTYLSEAEIQKLEKTQTQHGLCLERLLPDQVYLVVSDQHRLADCTSVDTQDLEDERLASANKPRNDKVVGNLLMHGKQVTRFSSFDLMFQAVLDQGMVGFAPGLLFNPSFRSDLDRFRKIPLKNTERENKMFLCLLTYKNRNLRYQESILLACIREYFQMLSSNDDEIGGVEK
jgi:DNA-binding transcriptional LysR family regulator